MRIAAYNIMSGGFNSYISTTNRPERLGLLQEAIQNIKADFIGLLDTFRWVEVFNTQDIKRLFGYKEVFHINLDDVRVDKRVGITVLSNLPMRKFQTVSLQIRNCVKTEIKFKNKVLNVFTLYLDDLSEKVRLQQTKVLLNQAGKSSTILMGDFNALRPEDVIQTKAKFNALLEANPSFKERKDYETYFIPVFKGLCLAKVIPLIHSSGFIETNSEKTQHTCPTPLLLNTKSAILKLDHMFYSPDLRIDNFQVLTGDVFDKASDHYPIVGEVSFN